MKLEQYLLDKKLKREDFAKQCGVGLRTVQYAIANDYIIVGCTVYSPRFTINEGGKNE
tara:strand:+ start:747 stop:920 length:174 start_codon:yes stop_codon:yes gene_type:complete